MTIDITTQSKSTQLVYTYVRSNVCLYSRYIYNSICTTRLELNSFMRWVGLISHSSPLEISDCCICFILSDNYTYKFEKYGSKLHHICIGSHCSQCSIQFNVTHVDEHWKTTCYKLITAQYSSILKHMRYIIEQASKKVLTYSPSS